MARGFLPDASGSLRGTRVDPEPDIERGGRRDEARREDGVLRGLDIANRPDIQPFWDPCWEPLWAIAEEAKLPVHLHTIGGSFPD